MTTTPLSVRLPEPLRARLCQRAAAERRSLSNQIRVLLEAALDGRADDRDPIDVDPDEVERLADVARLAIEEGRGG